MTCCHGWHGMIYKGFAIFGPDTGPIWNCDAPNLKSTGKTRIRIIGRWQGHSWGFSGAATAIKCMCMHEEIRGRKVAISTVVRWLHSGYPRCGGVTAEHHAKPLQWGTVPPLWGICMGHSTNPCCGALCKLPSVGCYATTNCRAPCKPPLWGIASIPVVGCLAKKAAVGRHAKWFGKPHEIAEHCRALCKNSSCEVSCKITAVRRHAESQLWEFMQVSAVRRHAQSWLRAPPCKLARYVHASRCEVYVPCNI